MDFWRSSCFGIGWTAGAQLSIVNVINYIRGPFAAVDIGFYLAEPLIVIVGRLPRCFQCC
jgi:hypothetical protein